jgi:hypothetical protein
MQKRYKKRADSPKYVSPKQLTIEGFETPFEQTLNPSNRWVVLANLIPWDEVCETYQKHKGYSPTGRHPISPRVMIGSIIIKHLCNLDDRETVAQISENIYMQYFLGYASFSNQEPFDASLLTVFRKRLGMDLVNAINEQIVTLKARYDSQQQAPKEQDQDHDDASDNDNQSSSNKGKLIMDATACPQDIAYPTDLDLLSDARVKSEQLIDQLYDITIHKEKPRTYRQKARKKYLEVAQNRNKSRKIIRKAIGEQLRFLKRNIRSINRLLDSYATIPLKSKDYKYLLVIQTLYQQQNKMFEQKKHSIDNRIVSIHQPHVRPIVRGKSQAKVEFGAKIQVSLIDGISFLDKLSWEAFNEGVHMLQYIEQYRSRFGFYPKEVLADKIYCTRVNRALLKEKGIRLIAKPLGRPPAVPIHLSPGERNPIEGKFGQAKTGYGLNRIKAKLMETSETWIASILLVLNLVKLAGLGFLWRIFSGYKSFSASWEKYVIHRLEHFSAAKLIFQRRFCPLNPLFKSFENETIFL